MSLSVVNHARTARIEGRNSLRSTMRGGLVALILMSAGCTASAPVTSYQPPMPQQNYPATVNVPNGWAYSNGGYYAPPRPVSRGDDAQTTPEPYRPEPAAFKRPPPRDHRIDPATRQCLDE